MKHDKTARQVKEEYEGLKLDKGPFYKPDPTGETVYRYGGLFYTSKGRFTLYPNLLQGLGLGHQVHFPPIEPELPRSPSWFGQE